MIGAVREPDYHCVRERAESGWRTCLNKTDPRQFHPRRKPLSRHGHQGCSDRFCAIWACQIRGPLGLFFYGMPFFFIQLGKADSTYILRQFVGWGV